MGRRARQRTVAGDDPTTLAGWLYADVLLGFAVIFLGGITFLVIGGPSAEGTASGTGAPAESLVAPASDPTTTSTAVPSTTTTSTSTAPSTTSTTTTSTSTTSTTTTVPATTTTVAECVLDREQLDSIRVARSSADSTFAASVESAVAERLAARGPPPESRIGFALVFAGGPSDDAARARAAETAERLITLLPDRFGAAASRPFFDRSLSGEEVHLDLFVLRGDC